MKKKDHQKERCQHAFGKSERCRHLMLEAPCVHFKLGRLNGCFKLGFYELDYFVPLIFPHKYDACHRREYDKL